MALFSKEKDVFLKVVNSFLVLGAVVAIIIAVATGIKLLNKENVLSYDEYAKKVCTIDKLEYECVDETCKKETDKERNNTCYKYYVEDKKEKESLDNTNKNNFYISLSASLLLVLAVHLLNKKL